MAEQYWVDQHNNADLIADIVDVFEDYLYDKGINIPNKERDEAENDGDENCAILFGTDYYQIEDKVKGVLSKYNRLGGEQ